MEHPGLLRLGHNVELGGSGDFRVGSFPLPLRASLAFSQASQDWSGSQLRFGTLSLDAVGHPLPKFLGTRLYLLGGLGVGTRAAYSGVVPQLTGPDFGTETYVGFHRERRTWGFVETGAGLELGRAFVQWKLQWPVASQGYVRAPLSIGFRF
jgi:hypothetical protein